MTVIEWNDVYRVEIAEIDRQHRTLFDTINLLHDALRDDQSALVLRGVLDQLTDYAQTHFATEERYFREYDFPGADEHVRQHESFRRDAARFRERLDTDDVKMLSIDVLRYTARWLVSHVSGADHEYATYFARIGVTERQVGAASCATSRTELRDCRDDSQPDATP